MKRILCCVLAVLTLLGTAGCAAKEPVAETTEAAAETTQMPETTEATTVPTEPVYEGSLFLKASSVNLSLVGDTEDIYLGLIPKEAVTWESDDESVVTFQDGVLTATGVGSTTVRAIYRDQVVECKAGCLANTQEELLQLPEEVLRAPRRLPPAIDLTSECTELDEATIIGDSITYFLFQWESRYDYMGKVQFLAKGGVSLNGFVLRFKNISYRGREMNLEDAIAASGVKKAFIMMGQNDISSKARVKVMENWTILLERIREKAPDVEIYIQSCIPERSTEAKTNEKNERIYTYNETLRQFAKDNGCKFIDLEYYIKDHVDKMPVGYSQGNYHMNEQGCLAWMQILRFYAEYENEGGILE